MGKPLKPLQTWRPRRDLNPCYRRERTTTIRKYNDLQEAGGHLVLASPYKLKDLRTVIRTAKETVKVQAELPGAKQIPQADAASEIGVERDRLDSGCLLFRAAQDPRRGQLSLGPPRA